jgi:hypothetical protein
MCGPYFRAAARLPKFRTPWAWNANVGKKTAPPGDIRIAMLVGSIGKKIYGIKIACVKQLTPVLRMDGLSVGLRS